MKSATILSLSVSGRNIVICNMQYSVIGSYVGHTFKTNKRHMISSSYIRSFRPSRRSLRHPPSRANQSNTGKSTKQQLGTVVHRKQVAAYQAPDWVFRSGFFSRPEPVRSVTPTGEYWYRFLLATPRSKQLGGVSNVTKLSAVGLASGLVVSGSYWLWL